MNNKNHVSRRAESVWIYLGVALLLVSVFALWSTHLDDPYVGRHENNTAWNHIAGRNFLHYGYLEVSFIPVMNVDYQTPIGLQYYHHNPPMMSNLIGVGLKLFGDQQASARLVPMFLTLIAGAAVFKLSTWQYNSRVGLLSLLLFVSTPMIAYYGQMAVHEELALPLMLVSALVYLRYRQRPSPWLLAFLAILLVLGVWSAWSMLLFGAALGLHALLFGGRSKRVLVVTIGLAILSAAVVWLGLSTLEMPHFWDNLWASFRTRTGTDDNAGWKNTVDYFWQMLWGRIRIRYTESLLVLSALGLLLVILRWSKRSESQKSVDAVLAVLLFPASFYVLVLRQASFAHDYFTYYFSPTLAILGAIALVFVTQRARQLSSPPIQRVLAAAGLTILVVGLIMSDIRWIRSLYRERNFFPVKIAEDIRQRVPAGQILYSNVDWWPAIWIYSGRQMEIVQVDDDLDPARYYLFCTPDIVLPSSVQGEYVQIGNMSCEFISPVSR